MTARAILLLLLPVVALIALTQRRRLFAIIGMGVFSLLLAAVYLLLHAPDVAVTEAAIGAVLVTMIYVLAIRRTGRIVVIADEAPGLLAREGDRLVGVEFDILSRFAHSIGLDLTVQLAPYAEARRLIEEGEGDLRAGGVVSQESMQGSLTQGYLDTCLVCLADPKTPPERPSDLCGSDYEGDFSDVVDAVRHKRPLSVVLDLARFLHLSRGDLSSWRVDRSQETCQYVFHVAPHREDLAELLDAFVARLKASGELERMIQRHLS